MSSPDDPAEREADAVAERVIEMDTTADAGAERDDKTGTVVRDYQGAGVIPTVPAHRASRSAIDRKSVV